MSFRVKITVLYATILTAFFLCFAGFSFLIARRTLLGNIDQTLSNIANRVVADASVYATGSLTVMEFPDDMNTIQTASYFMVAVNNDGEVIARSDNLASFEDPLLAQSAPLNQPTYDTVPYGGEQIRVYAYPLIVEQQGEVVQIGTLQIGQTITGYLDSLSQLANILVFIGISVFVFFLLLGAQTTRNLLKPLEDITATALQMTRADDLQRRIPDHGRNDEIGTLTMALNQTFERLEKLFRGQQRLLADVSHELRTPLTTVRGNIDLMRRMGEFDEELLDIITDELKRMSRLVGDLLLLARADVGSVPVRRQTIDLDTVMMDVYRQVQPLREQKDITVNIKELTPVRVAGDSDRIRQLVLILVDNAIKYTPEGGRVTLSLTQEGTRAIFSVSDNGLGIQPEHLTHIFERFYRVDKARTRSMGGSGLGLSIAKWVTESHGGRISVGSTVGEGTTFTVNLPALKDEHTPIDGEDDPFDRRPQPDREKRPTYG